MTDYRCNCDSRDLLWHGCRCREHKPRTLSINMSASLLGWSKTWDIVKSFMWRTPVTFKVKTPTDEVEVMRLIWEIEQLSPDLYEEIARRLEEEAYPPKKKTVKFDVDWEL